MENNSASQYEEKRFVREIGRPYFLPFFVMFIIALFGEIQVAMTTVELPAIWTGSFLFSHFGLFLSLSLLTMAGVVWAVRHGVSDRQRRLALAGLTFAVVMAVFFWPTPSEPLAPVFRISLETAQKVGHEMIMSLRDGTTFLQ